MRGMTLVETLVAMLIAAVLLGIGGVGAVKIWRGKDFSFFRRVNKSDDWARRENRDTWGNKYLRDYLTAKGAGELRAIKPLYRNGALIMQDDGTWMTWGDVYPDIFDVDGLFKGR